jgi:hypothetical protein
MTKTLGKFVLLLINVFLVVFPLIFAINVYTSFTKEENIVKIFEEEINLLTVDQIENTNCSSTIVFNVGFAVLLAALWNSTKVIKIGTI